MTRAYKNACKRYNRAGLLVIETSTNKKKDLILPTFHIISLTVKTCPFLFLPLEEELGTLYYSPRFAPLGSLAHDSRPSAEHTIRLQSRDYDRVIESFAEVTAGLCTVLAKREVLEFVAEYLKTVSAQDAFAISHRRIWYN